MEKKKEVKLSVRDLKISFRTDEGKLQAVRGVSFDVYKGETLAIVGESGSGKSVTNRAIMGILAGNAVKEGGEILYDGKDLVKLKEEEFQPLRGDKIAMIFQDPMSGLNPIMRVGKQLTESMFIKGKRRRKQAKKQLREGLKALKKKKAFSMKEGEGLYKKLKKSLKKGARLENEYHRAMSAVEDGLLEIEDALLRMEKNAFKGIRESVKEIIKLANAYAVIEQTQRLKLLLKGLKRDISLSINERALNLFKLLFNREGTEKGADYISAKKRLREVKEFLIGARKTQKPDFFEKYVCDTSLTAEELAYLKEKGIDAGNKTTKSMAKTRAIKLLKEVGIPDPVKRFYQYPFELSGGMRQRIVIAIALSADPDILICDEPTTALDVTIQAQILELINRVKKERRLSVIFITHDLGVVANIADRVAVMYAGEIVEMGTADDIFYAPAHPYTWALLSSMPDLDEKERLESISGTPPNMISPPNGDAFARRSKYAMQIDFEISPPVFQISDTHSASTWLLHPNAPKVTPPKSVTDRINRRREARREGNG